MKKRFSRLLVRSNNNNNNTTMETENSPSSSSSSLRRSVSFSEEEEKTLPVLPPSVLGHSLSDSVLVVVKKKKKKTTTTPSSPPFSTMRKKAATIATTTTTTSITTGGNIISMAEKDPIWLEGIDAFVTEWVTVRSTCYLWSLWKHVRTWTTIYGTSYLAIQLYYEWKRCMNSANSSPFYLGDANKEIIQKECPRWQEICSWIEQHDKKQPQPQPQPQDEGEYTLIVTGTICRLLIVLKRLLHEALFDQFLATGTFRQVQKLATTTATATTVTAVTM